MESSLRKHPRRAVSRRGVDSARRYGTTQISNHLAAFPAVSRCTCLPPSKPRGDDCCVIAVVIVFSEIDLKTDRGNELLALPVVEIRRVIAKKHG